MSVRIRAGRWESLTFPGLTNSNPIQVTGPALVTVVVFVPRIGSSALQAQLYDLEYAPSSTTTLPLPRLLTLGGLGSNNQPNFGPVKFRRGVVASVLVIGTVDLTIVFRPLTRAQAES